MSHLSDELPISISNLYNTSTIKQKYQKRILTINLQGLEVKPIRRTIKMTNSKKAFAYVRTSNKTQLETDEDLKGQYQRIKKYAETNGITIVRWFRDVRGTGRIYLDELIEAIECGNKDDVNYALVDFTGRLGRCSADLAGLRSRLDAQGVSLKMASEEFDNTPTGRLMDAMQELYTRYSNESKAQFTREKIASRHRQGYYPNNPLFGYATTAESGLHNPTRNGRYLGEYLRQAANGNIGTEELRLKVSQLLGKAEPISTKRLKDIALRPYYAGFVLYNGISYDGKHEALIAKEEHEKLKAMFA